MCQAVVALHDRISESEEKGVSLVPIVSGPCDEGVDVGDAHVVYANAPLATVDDRRLIEGELGLKLHKSVHNMSLSFIGS
jgi:hypothetical protein